jgi:hypothetical protein
MVNKLFIEGCEQFSAAVGVAPLQVVAAPYKAYASVLDVLEDSLMAVLDATPNAASGTDRLLSHERRYLAASARAAGITDLDDVDLNRIAAGLTLYGAASEDEAAQIVAECNSDLSPMVRRQVARLFRRLYPGPRTYIDGLRPDALAEDLLAGVLATDGRLPAAFVGPPSTSRTPEQRRRALLALARGSMRHSAIADELEQVVHDGDISLLRSGIEVATQVEAPNRLIAAIATAVEGRPTTDLTPLLEAVPDESVALADFAAGLARRTMADLPYVANQTLHDVVIAMNCSNRFSDAGWSAEAADSAQVAVDRLLLLDRDEEDVGVLGRALSNLSNRLWELGELSDSLTPAQEAVRRLEDANAALSIQAAAHNNLAFRLSELERHDEALIQIAIAERICKKLDSSSDPDMAKTQGSVMNNFACILLATGEASQAAEYSRACVDLRRSQALQNRDRFLPYVARALANAAPAAEASGDSALADRLLIECRSLHRLTGARAPIFGFEQAESATLASLIHLGRREWAAAQRTADEARETLSAVPAYLRQLSDRLADTLSGLSAAAAAHEEVSVLDAARGGHPTIQMPRLFEYRDL